jgi:hypothetical protein
MRHLRFFDLGRIFLFVSGGLAAIRRFSQLSACLRPVGAHCRRALRFV